MDLLNVTDHSFTAEVLESDAPVLVDFWAAWCGPCRVMNPILADLAGERDDVRVVKLDTEANQETAIRYGVLAMPTFMLFRGGEPVLKLVGSRPRRGLEGEISPALAACPPASGRAGARDAGRATSALGAQIQREGRADAVVLRDAELHADPGV